MKFRILWYLIFILIIVRCQKNTSSFITNQSEIQEIDYDKYQTLISENDAHDPDKFYWFTIDIRDSAAFGEGYIYDAINIDLNTVLDTSSGQLINNGIGLTKLIKTGNGIIAYSDSNDNHAMRFCKALQQLETYPFIYYYNGGVKDWRINHHDYLCVDIDHFIDWHEHHYPFQEGSHYLIDVNPATWYTGEETLNGHIPGAINIPIDSAVVRDEQGNPWLVNHGIYLKNKIPDKKATLYFYNVGRLCALGNHFAWALLQLEYENAYRLPRGYDQWEKAGKEFETE